MKIQIDKYSGRPRTLRDEARDLELASKKVIRMVHSPVRCPRYSWGRFSGSAVPVYQETCFSDFVANHLDAFDFPGDFVAKDMSDSVSGRDLYSD